MSMRLNFTGLLPGNVVVLRTESKPNNPWVATKDLELNSNPWLFRKHEFDGWEG